jgi:hypothetical protein
MRHSRDAGYYRQREQIELERAKKASHSSARRAHLGLAALFHSQWENALNATAINTDGPPLQHPPSSGD